MPTDLASLNRADQARAWHIPSLYDGDNFVALEHGHAERLGLPTTLSWPRDQNKGQYILAGAHKLHSAVNAPLSSDPANL